MQRPRNPVRTPGAPRRHQSHRVAKAHTVVLPRPVAGWQLLLAAGGAVIVAYYVFLALGPSWGGTQVALYAAANGTLAVCCLVAARRHPALAGMALLMGGSAVASIFGDVVFYFLALVEGEVAYPS